MDIAQAVPSDSPRGPGVWPWAADTEFAERLWHLSEVLIGVKFTV